jgi:hypothetical protein
MPPCGVVPVCGQARWCNMACNNKYTALTTMHTRGPSDKNEYLQGNRHLDNNKTPTKGAVEGSLFFLEYNFSTFLQVYTF